MEMQGNISLLYVKVEISAIRGLRLIPANVNQREHIREHIPTRTSAVAPIIAEKPTGDPWCIL